MWLVLAANGLEEQPVNDNVLEMESDEDADGEAVDPVKAKPKVGRETLSLDLN